MLQVLDHPIKPHAVLCTSADIAHDKFANLRARFKQYVKAGGCLILGGQMAHFLQLDTIEPLFASCGLSWKHSRYSRETHELLPSHPRFATLPASRRAALASSYSAKALMLGHVPRGEALYRAEEYGEEDADDEDRSAELGERDVAAAAAKVGVGWVAYWGDVNQEEGTPAATLVLLGWSGSKEKRGVFARRGSRCPISRLIRGWSS
ncbi:hypothetical protein JCM1841_006853 [Sporobolomyces salmonicolor]